MNEVLEKPSNKPQKIALAHDFLLGWGGAERTFKVMADMYPAAPIYTLPLLPWYMTREIVALWVYYLRPLTEFQA